MSITFLHAADFHLDSPFAGLSGELAKQRREESRGLPERLADYVNNNDIQLVLLAGDLFDSGECYRETLERMAAALGKMRARVFIAPGNHDYFDAHSPYALLDWPENVHIFRASRIKRVELPELGCAVYGAAFTSASQDSGLLEGFCAPEDGLAHLMVLHGEAGESPSRYNPLTRAQIAASKLDYLALGHTHRFDGVQIAGRTSYAYAGCTEGRGFDECGDKGFLRGGIDRGEVNITFVPFARRRYWQLTADVSGKTAENALLDVIPDTAAFDSCRVCFTGETDGASVNIKKLMERFSDRFYMLELRDLTRLRRDVWSRAGEDSLRGLFLRELHEKYDAAEGDAERKKIELAARYGLAALEHREI